MKELQNISDLCRFVGMVNQLSKFSPPLAEKKPSLYETSLVLTNGCGGVASNKPLEPSRMS